MTQRGKRFLVVGGLLILVGIMTTAVSYSVTIYRTFCELTGAGGTTQRAVADTAKPTNQLVTVFFDTNTAPDLPWRFTPLQRSVTLRLGEQTVVYFHATNLTDKPIIGHATFNVTPSKAGLYFKKIACFCFTAEKLDAHASVDMPVQFYVDPRIATDPGTRDVNQITLSYTFFRAEDPTDTLELSRFAKLPGPQKGADLFAANCAACHDLDAAKVGPPLRGVVGRRAGSVSGYPYTAALVQAGFVWTPDRLNTWLSGPRAMVPGVAMPMSIADPAARAAIIAWLEVQGVTQVGAAQQLPPGG